MQSEISMSHNSQVPSSQSQMNSLVILPHLFSMNQANNSTRLDDDHPSSAIDEREIRENHGFLPINYCPNRHHVALHIRAPEAYNDADNSDDLRAFPLKLHACLDDAEKRGFSHIISWQSHSLFKVKDVDAFEEHIMPQYFRSQTKYKSFQRQLNLYEFDRVPKGPFRGSYMHPFFKRGQHEMSNRMRLRKIKGRNSVSGSPRATKPGKDAIEAKEANVAKESAVRVIPQPVQPVPRPTPQPQSAAPTRRPKNRPTPSPQCTFEGRKFFPI